MTRPAHATKILLDLSRHTKVFGMIGAAEVLSMKPTNNLYAVNSSNPAKFQLVVTSLDLLFALLATGHDHQV